MSPSNSTATDAKTASPNAATISIRTVKPEDLPTVHDLFRAGFMYYTKLPEHSYIPLDGFKEMIEASVKDDLSKIEDVYFASGGHFWVATTQEDGKEIVVGMVGLEGKPNKEGELRRMSVNEDYRRYGIGRLLVSTLENWAKDNGITKVWLSTGALLAQANKFYVSIGYSKTRTAVIREEPRIEVAYYEKELA